MARPILSLPHLQDEAAAFAYLEARIWPEGPVCPKCGAGADRCGKLAGKTTRPGLWKCYACMKPFTVKMGTVFESSHVPLHVWLQAVHLMVSSKKGVSSNQIHRTMGVTLKTAWFMTHRIRLAMAAPGWPLDGKLGGRYYTLETAPRYSGRALGSLIRRLVGSQLRSPCWRELFHRAFQRFVGLGGANLPHSFKEPLELRLFTGQPGVAGGHTSSYSDCGDSGSGPSISSGMSSGASYLISSCRSPVGSGNCAVVIGFRPRRRAHLAIPSSSV